MGQLFANAARATLATAILDTDTTLAVLTGQGGVFPVADTGAAAVSPAADWFKLVLEDALGIEVVYVRTHTSGADSLTNVLRGQEGTTARAFDAGAVVGLRVTAADMAAAVTTQAAVVTEAGSTRALTPADAGAYVRYTATGAKTGTFDSAAGFAAGMEFHLANRAASENLTLSGTGVTLNAPKGGTLVLEPGDTVTVKFVSGTVADVIGSTEAA